MSDFLIYAARLQDAGVTSLWVSLGSDKDRTRLMHVSPASGTPPELAARFPMRTFELCGTDRVLERLKDKMAYAEGGPTAEMLKAAIEKHPMLRDDLVSWFADFMACKPLADEPPEEGDEPELSPEQAEASARFSERMKGMLAGLDIARCREAATKP